MRSRRSHNPTRGGPALREKFAEEAAAIGMTIDEMVQTGQKRRGRPPKDREEA